MDEAEIEGILAMSVQVSNEEGSEEYVKEQHVSNTNDVNVWDKEW